MEFSVGDRVYVGYPLIDALEPRGAVESATVLAVDGTRRVVMGAGGGIVSVGEPWSVGAAFATEAEAWRHCAAALRVRAAELAAAAARCDAAVVPVAVEA